MGFSLIEVLVVIAITSTLAIGAMLIWSRNSETSAIATSLVRELSSLQRRAMLSGNDHRIVVTASGWHSEWRSLSGWKKYSGSRHSARIESAPDAVVLYADGRKSEATVVLEDNSQRLLCQSGEGGIVTCQPM